MNDEYPFDHCPDCKEEIREGSLRWNGETWEHKSRSNHSQAGHHRIQVLKRYPKVLRHYSKRRGLNKPDVEKPVGQMKGNIYIQEKIDGSCFRFGLRNGELLFGSKKYVWNEEEVGKQFKEAKNYIQKKVDPKIVEGIEKVFGKLTFFGENTILHNIDYNWDEVPQVIGFDVYSHGENRFLHPDEMKACMEILEIQHVPFLEVKDADEINWDDYELPESKFRDGKPEGVVVKNPETGIKGKILREDFDEHNKMSFGFSKSFADSDEEKVIAEFCPNIRIIKQLQKQVNEEDRELSMKDMMGDAQVHTKVLLDMWEEEYASIVHKNWEIDMNKLKKLVTDRTKKVLKRRINIKERNNLTDQEALSMRWDKE